MSSGVNFSCFVPLTSLIIAHKCMRVCGHTARIENPIVLLLTNAYPIIPSRATVLCTITECQRSDEIDGPPLSDQFVGPV